MNKKEKLDEIFGNDPFGLLRLEDATSTKSKTEEQRLIESFAEVSEFYEEHGREPESENGLAEHILRSRLKAIRANPKKVKLLQPYDFYDLLQAGKTKSVTIEEIIGKDPFGLLNIEDGDISIFDLKHVKKTERIRPDYISRRQECKDFEEYEDLFDCLHQDLKEGKRRLVEFDEKDVAVGRFFILRGVALYLEKSSADMQEKEFDSGSRKRLDGRTRCIFDNGTESTMLLRSLNKALSLDGFGISEVFERTDGSTEIADDDVQNGYIYILKSKSNQPEISRLPSLYKVGHSIGDVTQRIRNASNEPTYLMSDVQIVSLFRCFNLNVKHLETNIHDFFREVNVDFELKDHHGKAYRPREWFVAPLSIIEEAVQLIVNGQIERYKYDRSVEKIVLRNPRN